MSVDYSAQQPTAMWNPARGVWEIPMENILCEHWGLFSATFPTSGMMRDGKLFPLPPLAHHTDVKEYSSLPTPNKMDMLPARTGEALERTRKRGDMTREHMTTISNLREAVVELLPTVVAITSRNETSGRKPGSKHHGGTTIHDVVYKESFGDYAPAIHQWETITGNPAPPPTIPDGRDGQARLNPAFAEWMMGLKPGWITDCDITRNEQLKACGNGVVPQQASKAITQLLQGLAP